MLYHKKYNVDSADIVDGTIKWQSTGNGAFIIAEYNGEKYFVKRNTMGPRIPPKSIPEPVYSQQLEVAKWLENKQADMRNLMKGLSANADHIVVEEENFWDDDNLFTTVTRNIPNENKGFDYSTLDIGTFKKLCTDIALLIKKIHDAGVTHGDLKEKNILIQKSGSNLVPYLIDFDSSYPSDYATKKKKDGKSMLSYPVVYSEGYQSPEIAIYNFEDEGVVDAATITNKTDIFTLAIIFHSLWTKSFPAVIGDDCAVGEAIYLDTPIKIDAKFDIELGATNGNKFSSLLYWMLAKDATKRPTADQVIDAINDKLDVDSLFDSPTASVKIDVEPHDLHKASLEIFTKETLKGKGVKAFSKITDGGQYKYYVKLSDGTEKKLTIEEVVSQGYGKIKKASSASLWPEDEKVIELVSLDEISKKGVLSIEPKQAAFKKFYFIAHISGGGHTTSAKGLVDDGLARYKTIVPTSTFVSGDSDKPWPGHGTDFDVNALNSRNVMKVERCLDNGEQKYKITTKIDGGTRENIVKVSYMYIMKFIKK